MATAKEQEVKHTPTPWIAGYGERLSDGSDCRVIDSEEGSIAEMMCPKDVEDANAEFIVRAVNAHEALVEAARFTQSVLQKLPPTEMSESMAIDKLSAALALAEKES